MSGNNRYYLVKTVFALLNAAHYARHDNKKNKVGNAQSRSGNEESLAPFAAFAFGKPQTEDKNHSCVKNNVSEACKPVQKNGKGCHRFFRQFGHERGHNKAHADIRRLVFCVS